MMTQKKIPDKGITPVVPTHLIVVFKVQSIRNNIH